MGVNDEPPSRRPPLTFEMPRHFQVRLQDVNPDTPVGRHMWGMAEKMQREVGGHPQGFAMVMSADIAQQGIDDGSWGPTALVQVEGPGC